MFYSASRRVELQKHAIETRGPWDIAVESKQGYMMMITNPSLQMPDGQRHWPYPELFFATHFKHVWSDRTMNGPNEHGLRVQEKRALEIYVDSSRVTY